MERAMRFLDRWRSAGLVLVVLGVVVALGLFLVSANGGREAAGPSSAPLAADPESVARTLVRGLAAGDYASVESGFDDKMVSALPAAKLRETWQAVLGQQGAFRSVASVETAVRDPYVICLARVEFERGAVNVQVTVDRDRKVSGLWFKPAAAAWSPPGYADVASFHEVEVTVGAPGWPLPATLTLPNGDGPFPAVVLVHGSGPNDRDETVGPNKPFKDIAWALASRGIAVLRYDKRTLVDADRLASAAGSLTVKEETVDDAVAAVEALHARSDIDSGSIVLVGHSLGAYLAPRIAAATPPDELRGVVLLAAPVAPLEDVILAQYRYLAAHGGSAVPSGVVDAVATQVARIKSAGLSAATPATDLPLGIPAAYWLDLRGYDPANVAASQSLPMLILQGGRDYQVPAGELEKWRAAVGARPDVTLRSYPALNHLFESGTGASTPLEYEQPLHVDQAVVEDIAGWVRGLAAQCGHCRG